MKTPPSKHVTVCVCTFRRPRLLTRLLSNLDVQITNGAFSYSIVVADNDAGRSAEALVSAHEKTARARTTYCSEPRQNIALARNRALEHATGEYVAFIDDDEFPNQDWLAQMLAACDKYRVAGVLGPVRPHFEEPPPRWIIEGRFCDRPEHATGRILHWEECRTGNLLFRRSILAPNEPAFDASFGTGGEDKDFFLRMTQRGHVFSWCNEGVAYESVPAERLTRRYMLRRALLRGKNILKHSEGRMRALATSAAAAPLYLAILPLTLVAGDHYFMKYCIKFCDHAGRLMAAIGLHPLHTRDA